MSASSVAVTPTWPRLPYWGWGLLAVTALAPAVAAAPLAAYVLLIALFGLPHVLCELRYCDERFSHRLSRRTLWSMGGLLAGVATLRIAQALQLVPATFAIYGELALGAGLVLAAASLMKRHRGLGIGLGLAMTAGLTLAPIATFLLFAWLHNLTPLAFVAEITPKPERARTVAMVALPFLVLPLLVASGWPGALIHSAWAGDGAASLFGAGRTPLAAFLPRDAAGDFALPLFAAAVTAQTLHYFSVIIVLPRLLPRDRLPARRATLVPWPSWTVFYGGVALLAAGAVALYGTHYQATRAAYGVAAALHSWVELPLFLLALGAALTSAPEEGRPRPMTPH